MSKYFIAVYTNACKDYCDREFFARLGEIQGSNTVHVVDNTDPAKFRYIDSLMAVCAESLKDHTCVDMGVTFSDHVFHRNVLVSVLYLRNQFLASDADYFLIVESDVIPPADLLDQLDNTIGRLPADWGIIGCLYYDGFHDYALTGIQSTHHALSGCTLYRREVIEQYPFRISDENWAAFPDAWISYDVNAEGKFKIFNNHDIRCEHLHTASGTRQSKPI